MDMWTWPAKATITSFVCTTWRLCPPKVKQWQLTSTSLRLEDFISDNWPAPEDPEDLVDDLPEKVTHPQCAIRNLYVEPRPHRLLCSAQSQALPLQHVLNVVRRLDVPRFQPLREIVLSLTSWFHSWQSRVVKWFRSHPPAPKV